MNGQKINYENLAKEALRSVVKSVLETVASEGLPGDHHFYISFHTTAPGVKISSRISAQYPKEMTIVLQHQFWDLRVEPEHFEVRLSFSNIPELLIIPYSAIKVFFDPSVPYGLQFDQTARPEAVEDKTAFLEENWHIGAENSDLTIDELNEITSISGDELRPVEHAVKSSAREPVEADFHIDDIPEAEVEERSSTGTDAEGAEIVSLDAFRKKNN